MSAPPGLPVPSERRAVAVWLLVCCAAIAVMVVLGGVTRLAHAGLSIVEWRPITGVLPPLSDAEWEEAFAAYRQFPEYRKLNRGMGLSEFQSIYWLEYLHRLWGRIIGVLFLLPFLWFLLKRTVSGTLAAKLAGMFLQRLRFFLQHEPALIGPVLRIFLEAVEDRLKARSPGAPSEARFGAVTFIHRFGSALNANLHFDEIPPCISPFGSLPRSKSAPARGGSRDAAMGPRGWLLSRCRSLHRGHRPEGAGKPGPRRALFGAPRMQVFPLRCLRCGEPMRHRLRH